MKIRTDFVSNSSSSSFVICGKIFDREDIMQKTKKTISLQCDDEDVDIYKLYDKLYNGCNKLGLSIESEGYDEINSICIGLDMHEMKDCQTLKEFKENVVEKILKLGLNVKYKDIEVVSGGCEASGLHFFESCG